MQRFVRLTATLVVFSLASLAAGQTTQPAPASDGKTLKARLDERRAEFDKSAPPDRKQLYEQGIRDVAASGVLATAKKVGDAAPNFTLPDATGQSVSLEKLLEKGPVVLTWYRGGWCPYCNIQLKAYQEVLPQIQERGAALVAISPEVPDQSLSTKEKQTLEFTVLSDAGNKVAGEYGLRYTLPPKIAEAFGERLTQWNGDDSKSMPLAATYVVDQKGKIQWAFVSGDYRERAEPEAILKALDAIKAAKPEKADPK